ncbi:BlaI/MecI/CopY family transcriptional regulator [Dactylosporangium sp. NPDC000521]|uniref:BlaI/MecI/CopY family transcriptional regulator n=1 Tax=Dactylosporangium sp. NPDC000521 TaxID=3363975 RepID=UPI0036BE41F3
MRGFGELESAVMQQLWDRGAPATVREVLTDLVRQRDLAYTTVLTVMEKLYRKGYLDREPQGRAHAYRPLVSREEYTARLMREALTDSRDRAQALVNFVGQMTLDEAIALRSALTSYERKMLGQ